MPTLSNGSELDVWNDVDNESPDAILFRITGSDGEVHGPVGAVADFPFGSVDIASIDVFDGFFTLTTFTNEGRTQTYTTVDTIVFDNDGNYIRTLSARAAYRSTEILSVTAESPDDITVAWQGATEYFGGQNTQYGRHEIILEDGALKPDPFVNHAPVTTDMSFTLVPGQTLDDVAFAASDADYDLLSFVVVDGPDHGTLSQETRFQEGHYPFPQGHYFDSLHYHPFLNGNLFDYAAEAGFTGTDTFTVYATDGQANSGYATITITVAPPAETITLSGAKDVVSYKAYDHAVLVAALGGNDRITGSDFGDTLEGGAGNDRLRGAAGDDILDGGKGNDVVSGGKGDDVLDGGTGRDVLIGGKGSDAFVFDTKPGRGNVDWIIDFSSGTDEIRLDSVVFTGTTTGALDPDAFVRGKAALDADDRIIYHKASGRLMFDADGTGDADAVTFAMLTPRTTVTADDFSFV